MTMPQEIKWNYHMIQQFHFWVYIQKNWKPGIFVFKFLFILFIYFWLYWVFVAVCRLFSSCGEQGLLFLVVCGLLLVVASLVAEHGL